MNDLVEWGESREVVSQDRLDGTSMTVGKTGIVVNGGPLRRALRHFDTLTNKTRWEGLWDWNEIVTFQEIPKSVTIYNCRVSVPCMSRIEWLFIHGYKKIKFVDCNVYTPTDRTHRLKDAINDTFIRLMKQHPEVSFHFEIPGASDVYNSLMRE
jgi:hypothetical protein